MGKKIKIEIDTKNFRLDEDYNFYNFDYEIIINNKLVRKDVYSDDFSLERKEMLDLLTNTNFSIQELLPEIEDLL